MKYFNFNFEKNRIKPIHSKSGMNKRKMIITVLIIVLLVAISVVSAVYIANEFFRGLVDKYIFRKNITQENVTAIEINDDASGHIYAYDKYITVLNKSILKTYSGSGKKEFELNVTVNEPAYSSNNRFLCLGEREGQKVYLISGQNIIWQKDVDGKIAKVNVNKNGYVSVVVTGTSYKTIVITYNPEGKELFKTYLSSTIAIDAAISSDNKYLAIAEIDTSGSTVQSNIKIISMDKAASDPSNSIEYMYPANNNEIVTKLNYQDKSKLICLYDNSIHVIQNNNDTKLLDISNKKDIFSDIALNEHVMKITEKTSGLFADGQVQITNTNSKKENIYNLSGVPKDVSCFGNVISLNLGTEVHFIDTNGWLIKKYNSSQEIKDIVLGNSIAGIIYRDKIEIINL